MRNNQHRTGKTVDDSIVLSDDESITNDDFIIISEDSTDNDTNVINETNEMIGTYY